MDTLLGSDLQHDVFAPVHVLSEQLPDGSVALKNAITLNIMPVTLPQRVDHWSAHKPDRFFLTERSGLSRRTITYRAFADQTQVLGRHLASFGLTPDRGLMLVAANGIDHALLLMAAMRIGVPTSIVSPTYCATGAAPWGKFIGLVEAVTPGLIVADRPQEVREALNLSKASRTVILPLDDLSWLSVLPATEDEIFKALEGSVNLDTVAKLLFTSGSTGTPKAVINTQRMMVSNMQAMGLLWPVVEKEPPILVDWLPWNHTFGGNCCFNLALYFGGTLHIDDGKPTTQLIGQTVASLKECVPNLYFNVPAGYQALLPFLEEEPDFARAFLGAARFLFNAGAAMPASVLERLLDVMRSHSIETPIIGAWGSTETAPFSTAVYFPSPFAGNLGVPIPGTEIRLVPNDGRTELRVRGPNVTPGYWRAPEATAAAFDDEGFYCIGDAGRLADKDHPELGILFDGRVAENFKLASGTWVNVSELRQGAIAACHGIVSDMVIAGSGRDGIGALLFLNDDACRRLPTGTSIPSCVETFIREYNQNQLGQSTRIERFAIMDEPPNPHHGEITDKGYLNQRAVLLKRSDLVDLLYASESRL